MALGWRAVAAVFFWNVEDTSLFQIVNSPRLLHRPFCFTQQEFLITTGHSPRRPYHYLIFSSFFWPWPPPTPPAWPAASPAAQSRQQADSQPPRSNVFAGGCSNNLPHLDRNNVALLQFQRHAVQQRESILPTVKCCGGSFVLVGLFFIWLLVALLLARLQNYGAPIPSAARRWIAHWPSV